MYDGADVPDQWFPPIDRPIKGGVAGLTATVPLLLAADTNVARVGTSTRLLSGRVSMVQNTLDGSCALLSNVMRANEDGVLLT